MLNVADVGYAPLTCMRRHRRACRHERVVRKLILPVGERKDQAVNFIVIAATTLLASISANSFAANDPTTICETTSSAIPLPTYGHCKAGDLIEVDSFEIKSICRLDEPVIPLGQKFLCGYRGERRTIRSRTLTEVEKAYQRQQTEAIVRKYSN